MALTLYQKAILCEALVQGRHYYEGQVRQQVILPPAGLPDHSTGNHESDALATGMYLEALSFRWAATRDPRAKRQAKAVARALRKLQRLTGSKGCFARGFKRADGPTWDEQFFFFPHEWHQAGKYRWVGDPSTDSLVGLMSGYEQYHDLVADAKEKAEVAKDVDLIMGYIVGNGMRVLDVDGRVTLWGNMNPYILEENLNALQALSHLRAAHHITKKRRYLDEYHRLIDAWDYHKRAALANAQDDPPPAVHDWNLAVSPLYSLLRYEADEDLLRYYYRALEVQWKRTYANGPNDAFFNVVYKALHPRAPMRAEAWQWLETTDLGAREFPAKVTADALKPPVQERKFELVVNGKRKVIEAVSEVVPRAFLRAYWSGRYFGFISPEA